MYGAEACTAQRRGDPAIFLQACLRDSLSRRPTPLRCRTSRGETGRARAPGALDGNPCRSRPPHHRRQPRPCLFQADVQGRVGPTRPSLRIRAGSHPHPGRSRAASAARPSWANRHLSGMDVALCSSHSKGMQNRNPIVETMRPGAAPCCGMGTP